MSTSIEIKLKSTSKTYKEGENVSGVVILKTNSDVKHDGILLVMDGTVNLQISTKTFGIFEAFYNSVKPIQLIHYSAECCPAGKISSGLTEIPFELPIRPKANKTLHDTYHGVFVNIQYTLQFEIKRSFLSKDVNKSIEFIVETKPAKSDNLIKKPVLFKILPESIQNRDRMYLPKFCITGKLDTLECKLSEPLTGEVIIENSEIAIRSIELQLIRIETCGCAEGYSRDATEIQNIQIGEGNVYGNLAIPIYMIFPRLFTCPTLITSNFKVEFEVNLIIVFEDEYLITENFPIVLIR